MIALPPWVQFTILLCLLAAVMWMARRWISNRTSNASQASVAVLIGLALAAALWIHSFSAPVVACAPMDGLSVDARVDAQQDGYLMPVTTGFGYFRHAVHDLVQGRIGYFEIAQASGDVNRYHLASVYSTSCIDRKLHDEHLAELPMPKASCVGVVRLPQSQARYRLDGYDGGQRKPPNNIKLVDRKTSHVLALYHRPLRFANVFPLERNAECKKQRMQPGHPAWNLTSFVFRDQQGRTYDAAQHGLAQRELGATSLAADLLPPPAWVRRQLAHENKLARKDCVLPGWSGDTEVHALALDVGPLEISAKLDAQSDKAGVVLLDVHAPDKAVVILAKARGPTIWHIHESSSSSVVAVLVQAEHGQAVVGLTRYSRILMSTQHHNPHSNCSARELEEIVKSVVARYGITHSQSQADLSAAPVVRYTLGEPMRPGGELFHHDRELADFELRPE